MGEGIKLTIKKDIKIRLEKSNKKSDQARSAVRLVVDMPFYSDHEHLMDEDESITIATMGTDGNFTVSREVIDRIGLQLNVYENGLP